MKGCQRFEDSVSGYEKGAAYLYLTGIQALAKWLMEGFIKDYK